MPYKPAKRKTCELIHWGISILVILCIVSSVLAIVLGVLVAKPGILGLDFKTATCKVKSSKYVTSLPCDCGGIYSDDPNCKSRFPCYQITVNYEPSKTIVKYNESENYFRNEAMIRETESDFSSAVSSQCSYQNCHPKVRQNQIMAEGFKNKYGKAGGFYRCWYNPYNKDQVILSRRYNSTHVLLALVLPGSIFVLSLMILVGVCLFKVWRTKEKKANHPRHNPLSGPRNYLGRDMPAFEPDEAAGNNSNHLPDPFATINDRFLSDTGEKKRRAPRMDVTENTYNNEDPPQQVVQSSAQMSTVM